MSDLDAISLNAGSLIAAESGCLIADISGEPKVTAPANVVVTNPRLLKSMLKL